MTNKLNNLVKNKPFTCPGCGADRNVVEASLAEGVASPNYEVACFMMENCTDCLMWHGAVHLYRFRIFREHRGGI